jgi:hypothetical protein
MRRFDPNAPIRLWLEKYGHQPVSKLAALAVISGLLLGCIAYFVDSIWLRALALIFWIGGCLFMFGLRRHPKANDDDKDSSGPRGLY